MTGKSRFVGVNIIKSTANRILFDRYCCLPSFVINGDYTCVYSHNFSVPATARSYFGLNLTELSQNHADLQDIYRPSPQEGKRISTPIKHSKGAQPRFPHTTDALQSAALFSQASATVPTTLSLLKSGLVGDLVGPIVADNLCHFFTRHHIIVV